MEKILVVATHPDDETFGAGGYLLRMKEEGSQVYVLNLTHLNIEAGFSEDAIAKRNIEIEEMIAAYKLDGYFNLKLTPTALDEYSMSELIGYVSKVIRDVQPTTLILPYKGDVHSDHRVAFDVCYSCTKSFRYPYIKKVLMMETPSETDFAVSDNMFSPNYFVDISKYIEKKECIARIFESEINEHPFPRSIRNIKAYGTIRGAVAGCDSAEAFVLLKCIV